MMDVDQKSALALRAHAQALCFTLVRVLRDDLKFIGYAPGETVICRSGIYKISRIEIKYPERISCVFYGYKLLRSGLFGDCEHNLGDMEEFTLAARLDVAVERAR